MGRDNKLTIQVAVGMVTIGFVLMFIAWNEAASLDYVQGQVPYLLSGTLPGLALVLTGLTLALVNELRTLAGKVIHRLDRLGATTEGPSRRPAAVPEGDHVVATASTFHSPDCHVVEGRTDLTPMSPMAAQDQGLTACRICDPEVAVA